MPTVGGIISYTTSDALAGIAEIETRDHQARGYLQHAKFPTQIARLRRFLARIPKHARTYPALDLGCGPGPNTQLLVDSGYRVVAVDFSRESLLVNRESVRSVPQAEVCHVQADLKQLDLAPACTQLLLMCDFLQHLGEASVRRAFLARAFKWLQPGGYFYLSFFNLNIKNYLKGDVHGAFAAGSIQYERLVAGEVITMFPDDIAIDAITPMNIFHQALPDRLAARLPGARFLSRLMAIEGHRRPA